MPCRPLFAYSFASGLHVIWGSKWPESSFSTYFSLSGGYSAPPPSIASCLGPPLLIYRISALDHILPGSQSPCPMSACGLCTCTLYTIPLFPGPLTSACFLWPFKQNVPFFLTKSQPFLTNSGIVMPLTAILCLCTLHSAPCQPHPSDRQLKEGDNLGLTEPDPVEEAEGMSGWEVVSYPRTKDGRGRQGWVCFGFCKSICTVGARPSGPGGGSGAGLFSC